MGNKDRTQEAVDFLRHWLPDGPWVLVAIHPDRKKEKLQGGTFWPGEEDQLREWLKPHVGTRNVYFHLNPVRRSTNNKAGKADMAAMVGLHVDVDPRAGEDLAEERERILKLLKNAPVPPTAIIDSGGGYQGFWKLEEPLPINGEVAQAEELERYNIQLEREFSADSCHNVDRIMRLPGTVNMPDKKKRQKGREPAPAKVVVADWSRVYPITHFTQAPKVQTEEVGFSGGTTRRVVQVSGNIERLEDVHELDEWGVPDKAKVVIVQGGHPDEPFPSRSEAVFYATCEMVRRGVPDQVIFSVLTDDNFGISESVLEQSRPERYALKQIESAHEQAIDPMLRELNAKHAVVGNMGGKCRIIEEVYDPALRRHRISRQSFEDFRNRYRNRKVVVGKNKDGKPIEKPAGAWWVDHPQRRQYETLVFAPGRDVSAEHYNLWKGYGCEALPGTKHHRFMDHVFRNICSGNEEHYRYLVGWMARAVQCPDEPGEVAVVLRGRKGTGKSAFVKELGQLFGRHFLPISNTKHLVGNFNAHLRDAVLVFGDEAFYAGDKSSEPVLKTLITEEAIIVEEKGVNAEVAPNFIHLILASNSDWVVPSSTDERRFFVLDVARDQMQNHDYFKAVRDDMRNGGRENLLHFLMNYDLSEYEVRDVPQTTALQDQKMHSLPPEQQWWFDKLWYGRLLRDHDCWDTVVAKDRLQQDYVDFMQTHGYHRKSNAVSLGRMLSRQFCPDPFPRSFQKTVEEFVPSEDGLYRTVKKRAYHYEFPLLARLREHWDENFGGPFDWPPEPVGAAQEEDEAPAF